MEMNKVVNKYKLLLEKMTGRRVSLIESPVDYTDESGEEMDDRMNPEIEDNIRKKQTDLSDNPAFPRLKNKEFSSYEELLISNSFKRAVSNLRKYTGATIHPDEQTPLTHILMQTVQSLNGIERRYRPQLAQLAIKVVMQEMGLEEGEVEFQASIVDVGSIDLSGMEQATPEERQETEEALYEKFESLDLEIYKRRFINSLTQGASVKAQNMHERVKEDLDKLNPQLTNLYGTLMAVNESMYWILPDETIDMLGQNSSAAGHLDVEPEGGSEGQPLIKAQAISFPALIHELVKGVMEVYALHGQGDDVEVTKAAMKLADSLEQEKWDLRLGPAIWETFREMFPDELFEDDKRYLEKYLIIKLYKMPAEEFNETMRLVLAGSPKGKKLLKDMLADVVEGLKQKHFNDNNEDEPEEEDNYA